MMIGYARTSTADQIAGYEAQLAELKKAGCDPIYQEQVSAVARSRPELQQAIEFVRNGDVLVVTKLDRLCRSVADFIAISDRLAKKGVGLRVLAMNLDTSTPTGTLMLNVLSSVAQFERELLLERQREGIKKAKAEGRYKGRKPTARLRAGEVLDLRAKGVKPMDIASKIGISVASVYRALAQA
ncbi:MAG: invertase [Hyphomicrobiales bacterium]|nr:invertase [Hyphomicrobiales bacterium]